MIQILGNSKLLYSAFVSKKSACFHWTMKLCFFFFSSLFCSFFFFLSGDTSQSFKRDSANQSQTMNNDETLEYGTHRL